MEDRPLVSVERYDPVENTWTEMPPMKHARLNCGLVVIKDELFVLGGTLGQELVASVEVFNIFKKTWREASSIAVPRCHAAYTVFGNKILMVGGLSNSKFYESVECYDPRSDTWAVMPPLKERRFGAQAVTINNTVYVIGGFRPYECPSMAHEGGMKLCDNEVYTSELQNWSKMTGRSQMCATRNSDVYGAVVLGENLFVAGKLSGVQSFHYLRMYHIPSASWHSIISQPPVLQQVEAAICTLQVPLGLLNI